MGYVYAGCVEVEPDRPGAPPRSWRAAAAAVIVGCVAVPMLDNGRHSYGLFAGDGDEAPGLSLIAGRRASELRAAEAAFVRRVGAHPRDAGALAGLAESAYLLGFYGVEARGPAMDRARDAAERAIAIDADQSRAYLVRGSIALDTQWNLAASARDFRRAVELDPDDPLVHQWSAWWCLAAGRMPEARAASARASRWIRSPPRPSRRGPRSPILTATSTPQQPTAAVPFSWIRASSARICVWGLRCWRRDGPPTR